jgi:hypothetical protein
MRIRIFYSIIFFLAFCAAGFAQPYLYGKVIKKASTEILPGVNVYNAGSKKYNRSDIGGNFKIAAAGGDIIIFSSAGYHSDTIVVNSSMLADGYDIFLAANIMLLPSVQVDELNKYEADSIKRKEDYSFILDKKHPVKLWNEKRTADAPGLNFSPVGFFSKAEKQKRKLKQRIKEEDENEYIDAKFPRTRIAQLTRLTGDSLQQFMLLYRPGYTFCRNAGGQDMLLYINDKLLLFRKGQRKKRNKL